jgi:hypothetical protein
MIIQANSYEEAVVKGQKIYRCKAEQLKVHAIKKPGYALMGLIKKEGEYQVEFVEVKGKDTRKEKSKDGCIEIISGKAVVSDPEHNGRYATIAPDNPNVDVYINGSKIDSVTIVSQKDTIEFKPASTQAATDITAELSEDKMKAVLIINKSPGRQYFVKDAPKSVLLDIPLSSKEVPAPDAAFDQCIEELKKINVSYKFMDEKAIKGLIDRQDGGSAVVAEGIYPIDGQDGEVKYLFQSSKVRNPDFDTDGKVDLLDHTILPTVEVGEVLAIKEICAVPGRDGETVTGETVKARQGRDMPFRAGAGTILLDNNTKMVAASAGRPMVTKGMVSVVPLLVIPEDVNPGTGNVYFNGDIQIKGSVMDNMKVVAEGDITVSGNVLQASLFAKGSVDILGNIISSKVVAGTGVANSLCVLPKMEQIIGIIRKDFYDANSEVWISGYRKMRERFPDAYSDRNKNLERIVKDIRTVFGLLSEEETDMVKGILKGINTIYAGGGAVTPKQINSLNEKIQKYMELVDNTENKDANLKLKYAQNSSMQANGDVLVSGRGAYQTDIIAKNTIEFINPSSVVLGGMLIAGKKISMGVVGSPAGISTYCNVLDKNGKIDAIRIYGNTVFSINNKKKVIS